MQWGWNGLNDVRQSAAYYLPDRVYRSCSSVATLPPPPLRLKCSLCFRPSLFVPCTGVRPLFKVRFVVIGNFIRAPQTFALNKFDSRSSSNWRRDLSCRLTVLPVLEIYPSQTLQNFTVDKKRQAIEFHILYVQHIELKFRLATRLICECTLDFKNRIEAFSDACLALLVYMHVRILILCTWNRATI